MFLKATKAARAGDPSSLIQWTNEYAGQAWDEPENSELVDHEELMERAEDYGAECPEGVQYIVIGGDVGKDHIAYEIVGFGYEYESWSLEYKRVMGDPATDPIIDNFERLSKLEFEKKDGTKIPVSLAMVDSRYLGHRVREVSKRDNNRTKILAITGLETINAQIVDMSNRVSNNTGTYSVKIGTQAVKDWLAGLLKVQPPLESDHKHMPGYQHFPKGYKPSDYKELCSESKKTSYKSGKPKIMWMPKTRGARGEMLDCRAYALAGMKLLEQRYGAELLHPDKYKIKEPESNGDTDDLLNQLTAAARA